MAVIKRTKSVGSQDMTLESGKLAMQAEGSVVVTYGETQILATTTTAAPREGIDFFPLTVDVEERMYAAGKIPGGFFRREGRPSETAILTARLIDRPLRPTFKGGYNDEVQVVVTVLSADLANPYDVPGINGASLSTMIAGLPFDGPVGAVRLGLIGGEWRINPTYQDLDMATFDVVVAGRRNESGGIDLLMIEGESPDNTWSLLAGGGAAVAPTEESVAEGLEAAKRAIGEMIDFQLDFLSEAKATPKPFEPKVLFSEETYQAVADFAESRIEAALVPEKRDRDEAIDQIKDELKAHLLARWGEVHVRGVGKTVRALRERAQHSHNRRHAAARADEQHPLGRRVGQHEVALRLAEADDHPRPGVVAQVARDLAVRVGRDGQLERAAGSVLRAGRRVGPGLADPVDLDAHAHELPGAQAAPVLVRAQRERDALGGLMADGRDLRAHVALDEQRADELDVAIDAVRVGERLEQVRAQ